MILGSKANNRGKFIKRPLNFQQSRCFKLYSLGTGGGFYISLESPAKLSTKISAFSTMKIVSIHCPTEKTLPSMESP